MTNLLLSVELANPLKTTRRKAVQRALIYYSAGAQKRFRAADRVKITGLSCTYLGETDSRWIATLPDYSVGCVAW